MQPMCMQVARIGEVVSKCEWEPESSLPPELVAEYNEGVERELVDEVYSSGGRTLHTICSQPLSRPAKMPCQHVAINDEG